MGSSTSWVVLALLLATGGGQPEEPRRGASDASVTTVGATAPAETVRMAEIVPIIEVPSTNAVPEPGAALLFGIGALVLRASVREWSRSA